MPTPCAGRLSAWASGGGFSRCRSCGACANQRPEQPARAAGAGSLGDATRRLVATFKELRAHKDAGLLLLAFLVYNDAVNTIIKMGVIYGGELKLPLSAMMTTLVLIQLVGVPFAFLFGMLADRIGAKRAIFITLAVYTGISVYAFTLKTTTQFLVMGLLVGTVQGGAQALARSLFASMIPQHKAGEMFGFFGVFDRFGGAIGLMIFGTTLALLGTSRPGDPEPGRVLRARARSCCRAWTSSAAVRSRARRRRRPPLSGAPQSERRPDERVRLRGRLQSPGADRREALRDRGHAAALRVTLELLTPPRAGAGPPRPDGRLAGFCEPPVGERARMSLATKP